MRRAKKKVVSGILGVSLSVMLAGSSVFAAGGSYKILSGDDGTYTKGSKSGYVIKVEAPYAEFESVAVDGKTIVKDKDYSVSGTTASDAKDEETADETTTEAPETETPDADETTETPTPTEVAPDPTTAAPDPTTQAPDPTTAAPDPTTQGPAPTEVAPDPTTAGPAPTEEGPEATPAPTTWTPTPSEEVPSTWAPTATQSAENGKSVFLTVKEMLKAIVNPMDAEAASNKTTVKVFSSYMDTLSVGTHKIAVNFENGTATATVTVKDKATSAKTTSATPKTGDTSNVTLYAFLAMVSGAIIVVEGKKRFSK